MKIRKLSLESMYTANIPPLELVRVGQQYNVASLFVEGMTTLLENLLHNVITAEELNDSLGLETTDKAIRSVAILAEGWRGRSPFNTADVVKHFFSDELARMCI